MTSSPCAAITPDLTGMGALCRFVVGKAWTAAGGVARNRLLKGGVVVRVDVGVSGLSCSGEGPNALHSSSSSTRRIEFFSTYSPSFCMFQELKRGTGMISPSGGWSQGKAFFIRLKYGPSILAL